MQVEDRYSGRSEGAALEMRPFRMMTSAERYTVETVMLEMSGLRPGQLAVNSWGFPFIPIPEPRAVSGGVIRNAPSNVNTEYLGHPIYWIDPELTEYDPEKEPESWWSIRMYYLIQALGYWTENHQWVNFLSDVKFDDIDVRAYHQAVAPTEALDRVKLLTKSDMKVPYEEYIKGYADAMGKCAEALVNENESLISRQSQAYHSAQEILSANGDTSSIRAEDTGGFWERVVYPNLRSIVAEYENRMIGTEKAILSDMADATESHFEYIENLLNSMNNVAAILTIPVLKRVNPSPESFSYLASYISVAVDSVAEKSSGYNLKEQALSALAQERSPRAMRTVASNVWSEYQKAWRRVKIASVNFDRAQEGLEPFTSFSSLEVDHGMNQSSSGNSADSEFDLMRGFDDLYGEIKK